MEPELKAVSTPGRITETPWAFWGMALVPVLATVLAFLPALNNGFINLDDPAAITENPHIRSLNASFFHWMFTTFTTGNWIPLTWFSLALDNAVSRMNPWFYHLHNVLWHGLNTLLVFLLCYKILILAVPSGDEKGNKFFSWKVSSAFLTALIFGLHPLRVESVAWVAERKDVLCAFFYLSSLLLYLKAVAHPAWKGWLWKA